MFPFIPLKQKKWLITVSQFSPSSSLMVSFNFEEKWHKSWKVEDLGTECALKYFWSNSSGLHYKTTLQSFTNSICVQILDQSMPESC